MSQDDKVNILLVDDQPAKLVTYEVILHELGENLLTATSGREALKILLRTDVAVVLVDVVMPELDGFELASMIRGHPRFYKTAIIFISAIQFTDMDRMRGYEMGAVDYVPVPVVPDVLRAKVKVFAELYRKTRELERLNAELEQRVAARTAELEASTARLRESEKRRSLALAAGSMGSWEWDRASGKMHWDEGQYRIFGVDRDGFAVTPENVQRLLDPHDRDRMRKGLEHVIKRGEPYQTEFRVLRPNGETRWCIGSAVASMDPSGRVAQLSGVTIDISDRKEAEERQLLLAREVDHRAKNALAVAQSILRLTRASSIDAYVAAVEGRINALSRVHTVLSHSRWEGADLHTLVDEELAPFRTTETTRVESHGPRVLLQPNVAQALALALHELATNAAKYGALSSASGHLDVAWAVGTSGLELMWTETGGPAAKAPSTPGFGTKIVSGSIERQLGGRIHFAWRRKGLQVTLSVPLNSRARAQGSLAQARRDEGDDDASVPQSRIAVAIVEDESLSAMALAEWLIEFGCSVVGPFGGVAEALTGLSASDIDVAILDINLDGETVYPVADLLSARGIPFVFVTGYAMESIDPRFSGAPVLQKPLEAGSLRRAVLASARTLR